MNPAPPHRLRLGRPSRLQQSREFARLRQRGDRLASAASSPTGSACPLAPRRNSAWSPAKKSAGRSERSRARRLLRESFRRHQHDLAQPVEMVLVARNSIAGKKFADVEKDFLAALKRARLVK